jgi:gliding motility-associated-like protein
LSDFPDGHYVASFDTLNRVPTLNQVQEYIFDLRITLTPTCAAALSGTTGDNSYQIASNISYTDRYYAISIGDGSCAESITDEALSTVVYNQPPTFALSALTAVIDTVANNSVSWDIQLCNTSATADAGLTWLALEDPAGVLSTVFFENITNPANAVALPVENYNAGSFAYTPALLRNNGLNSQDAYCTTIRITATVNDCRDASLALRSGWNCGPYAAANWNPGLYPPCEEQNLALSLTNLAVPPVQLGFQQVTSSCSGAGLETVNIRGTLSGGANVPQDDYRLRFIWDENGDATAQAGETVLAQLVVSGTISPDNPLVFNQLLQLTTVQACAVLVELTAVQTDLCGTVAAAMPSPQLLNAGTDQFVCTLDAPGTLTFNLGITSCDEASGHQFSWTAIAPASPADLDNPAVQNPVLTLDPVEHLGQTLVYVLETQKPGCIASSFDTVSVEIPVFSDGFSTADSVILQAPSCQSTADLCLNITAENLPNLVFFDNGFAFTGTPVSCSDTLFALQLTAGTHQVIITDTLSGCTDTVFVAVSCAIKDTVYLDLLLHQADTVCFSSAELSGPVISLQNDCEEGLFADYLVEDTCLIVIGQFAGQETACMVACDAAGFCDTTIVITTISHPLPNGIRDTITLTQEGEYCFDEQLLNLAGPIVSMENICTVEGGSAVSFSMDEANNCLQYTGLAVGVESACIRLCDGFGNCDTVGVAVTVVPGNVIMDTVFIHLDTNFLCAEAGLLPGNIVSVTDICPEDKGMEVVFFVSGECIRYFGKAVGTDTACVRFEDEFGNVALTQVIVSVVNTTPITFCDTVFVGQTKALCLDTTELFGAYDQDSFREICPDIRTENAGFSLEPLNICAFYEGVTPGKDSACVVICDEFGFCDTTYFCIFVKPYFDPPTLGNDTAYTEKARPVVIDFLQNDTIFGGIEDIYILDSTISGQVILNLDNSFTYIPTDPFCARWDHFTYVACNPNGCDTATVSIYIECIRLTIFTAISPNNDGANDLFYIAKIEDFPDNRLWVYNRWGNLVFETRAYKNTWPGNWGPDTDLPDGTYYYVLEWVDNGVTTVQRGYFEMYR